MRTPAGLGLVFQWSNYRLFLRRIEASLEPLHRKGTPCYFRNLGHPKD
jgi:hypothetical protein